MKRYYKIALWAWGCFLSVATARSQGVDTLEDMRLFLKVSHAYKQLPLQLDLQVENATNLVIAKEDTQRVDARFCLRREGSYISFGDMEQIVDDSLMLLVNHTLRRMILYPNRRSVAAQLSGYLGLLAGDSSLAKMETKYRTVSLAGTNGLSGAAIVSRSVLYGTSLSREEVSIRYNPATYEPSETVQIRRSLVPVSADIYRQMSLQPAFAGRLLSVDSSYYVIREQTAVYRYRHIGHDPAGKLPVRASDLIVAEAGGKYAPLKAYSDFVLNQSF